MRALILTTALLTFALSAHQAEGQNSTISGSGGNDKLMVSKSKTVSSGIKVMQYAESCSSSSFAKEEDISYFVFNNECEDVLKWRVCTNSYDHALKEIKEGRAEPSSMLKVPYIDRGEGLVMGIKTCTGESCIPATPLCELQEKGSPYLVIEIP